MAGWVGDHALWLLSGAAALSGIALGGGLDKPLKPIALSVAASAALLILAEIVAVVWLDLYLPGPLRRLFR